MEAVTHPPTFRERWTRWLQFWAVYARDPSLRGEMTDVYAVWCEPFRFAIETGVASGEFRPQASVTDLVDTTVALLDGLALQVLHEAPGASLERMSGSSSTASPRSSGSGGRAGGRAGGRRAGGRVAGGPGRGWTAGDCCVILPSVTTRIGGVR